MKKIIIIAIVILIITAAIIGGYIMMESNKKQEGKANNIEVNIDESKETNIVESNIEERSNKKTAVVYFSATGNTKQIAEYVKDVTDSDIFEIIPKQKYTSEDLNYGDNNTRATIEQRDNSARPEIENKIDVSNYDVIFLGYPIWWGDVPKIILSFIDNTNLNGKTIIPFCTSGSSGISTSENTLRAYNSNINWIKGNRFSSSTTKGNIQNWVDGLNILKTEQVNNIGDKEAMNEFAIEVNNRKLIVKTEENSASKALLEKLKEGSIIVNAHEYGGFEKVGDLGFSLPREDTNVTTSAGDIVLYQGNQISLFYNSNSWSYTKLGKIKDITADELKNILGNGDVTITITLSL